ncbi:hypothetical protein Scep_004117 [Stephania cephalantha]|uniref:Uncharacterized protein n=1 Tax=Stephania cephalantha TaxID=152367 RepID=A0AAP0KRU3_9MAGN
MHEQADMHESDLLKVADNGQASKHIIARHGTKSTWRDNGLIAGKAQTSKRPIRIEDQHNKDTKRP